MTLHCTLEMCEHKEWCLLSLTTFWSFHVDINRCLSDIMQKEANSINAMSNAQKFYVLSSYYCNLRIYIAHSMYCFDGSKSSFIKGLWKQGYEKFRLLCFSDARFSFIISSLEDVWSKTNCDRAICMSMVFSGCLFRVVIKHNRTVFET